MYKITITQLNEIQKLLTEVVNKARALREKNNRIYNLK